jgi:hypothetical protein
MICVSYASFEGYLGSKESLGVNLEVKPRL